jgi:excisionase family DNA binding protein
MYLTIPETASLLSVAESHVLALILQGRIRAVHDGEQFLMKREQVTKLLVAGRADEPFYDDSDKKIMGKVN